MKRTPQPAGPKSEGGEDARPPSETDEAWRAIEAVFRNDYPVLLATAAPYGGAGTSAEDIVQEAVVVAHEHFDDLRDEAKLLPWLKRITVNVGRRATEKRNRRVDRLDAWTAKQPTPSWTPRSIAEELFHLRLRRAVDELPGLPGETFRRQVDEDMSVREIAEDLGCPIGTVKANLHRARAALRTKMGDDYQALTGVDPA